MSRNTKPQRKGIFISACCLVVLSASSLAAMEARTPPPEAVLARIVEKQLTNAEAGPGPIQWGRVPGRGVLYLVPVNLSHLDALPTVQPDSTSRSDREWENARRTLHGEPALVPEDSARTARAIEAVRWALRDFGDRVEGQPRVVLYQGRSLSAEYGTPLLREPQFTTTVRAENTPGAVSRYSTTSGTLFQGFYDPQQQSPIPHSVVVVDENGSLAAAEEPLAGDTSVLARVMQSRLEASFPQEFWGQDTHGRPGTLAVVVGDWGPVVVFNMTFPIAANRPAESVKQDLWSQAETELRGDTHEPSVDAADASRLVDVLKDTLAGFGGRLRALAPQQTVTLLVFGNRSRGAAISVTGDPSLGTIAGRSTLQPGVAVSGGAHYSVLTLLAQRPAPDAASIVMQISGQDLVAAREESLSTESLLERIRVQTQAEPGPTAIEP